jgi:ubiquinol-cytochrome c reductase iron-sulfur subunit
MACENKGGCGCHSSTKNPINNIQDPTKRDFMVLAASATAAVGAGVAAAPFIGSMNPAADVRAMASTEVDISSVKVGEEKRVQWQGKTVFIRRRTAEEISAAKAADAEKMPDPAVDSQRVKKGKEEWLVVLGVCTHLGCIPNKISENNEAWFCPCHGSHYDTSGRIRKGPAPKNLAVPPYEFISETKIKIG